MSKARNLAGFAGSISSDNNLNVGIVTASGFVGNVTGNLTGTASTATAAATAYGLSGTPNLNVGVVTASSFSGNLTGNVTGNLTGTASTATAAATAYGLTGSPDVTVGVITATTISAGSTTGTSGQVLQSTGVGVTWTESPAGGKILQVVDFSSTGSTTTTSFTFVDTFLSASITPSSSSSKVLVMVSIPRITNTSGAQENFLGLKRDSTFLGTFGEDRYENASGRGFGSFTYVDSPSTTSSTTYYLQFRRASGTATVGADGYVSSIILMEIGQ